MPILLLQVRIVTPPTVRSSLSRAGWLRRFDVDKVEGEAYQFQGHREETAPHREDAETIEPAPTSSAPSEPPFVNFQLRAFNPKSVPWMSQEPLRYVDGMNVYLFSRGEPVHRVKPL